ncbi:MAG TPA: peptidylprolyl isomerase [Desulfomonilia bacterium]|nr:peptidylprolyl isomerase [Desulfomonilia bacterium]
MKRYLMLVVAACLSFTGCMQSQGDAGKAPRLSGDTVAQIGDEKITEKDVEEIISQIPAQYRSKYLSSKGRREIINGLVEMKMLAWEARRRGIDKQEDVQLKIGLIIDQTLAKEMESSLKKSVKLSDADIERYYREHLDKYATPERVKARHILVEKQDRARELLEQLRKGADFKELAKKNSTCPSAEKGGDLGWFGRGKMDPEFEKAAFAMKKGETSDVVKSSFGYHIIRLDDRRDPKTKTLEQAKKSIERALQKEQADRRLAELKEDIRKKANVKVNDEYFKRFDASPEAPEVEEARGSGEPEEQ